MPHRDSVSLLEFDELTDLPNMMYFRRHAGAYVRTALRRGRPAYMVYFNLENFSLFNERYGYGEGDRLLSLTAVAIHSAFPGFLLARISEDHFLLVCESINIERGILEVREQMHAYGRHANVELKAGILEVTSEALDVGVACDRAKVACDSIAHRYDRTFRWFDEALRWREERRHYIENHIDRAVEEGWIKVFFQPIVRTVTGEVCEFEALARWDDPRYGLLSPAVFVEVLEAAHLIHKLDACVVRKVCEEWHHLSIHGEWLVPVSVNLSRLDFELCDAFALINDATSEYEVPHQMLHVEVTESALNDSSELLGREIGRFRAAGYQVWLDDFGSGYSSLNTLKDYLFDVVKIDMAFLREFDSKPQSRVIIASIVNMAKQLGMQTLIEGVETPEQFDFLRDIGCEFVQGYLIGRPVPSERNVERIMAGELVMEHASLHGYYDRLGRINSLSATPFDFSWEMSTNERPLAEMLPLAVLERSAGEVSFMAANDAFTQVVHEIGAGALADVARNISRRERSQARVVQETLDKAVLTGDIESVDLLENGRHCVLRVRHVASRAGTDAFLVSLMNLSRFSDVSEDKRLQIIMKYLYAVYDEVNIVDMDEGTMNTIYRGNTIFPAVRNGELAGSAVDMFAQSYVHPSDRERYLRYMDVSTVFERVEANERNYLSEAFRVLVLDGTFAWVSMVLVPVFVDGQRTVLICTRRTNEEIVGTLAGEGTITKGLLWDTLLELVPAGVFWKDRDRRFMGVNKNFLDFYAFESTQDVLGKNDEDMGWHVDADPFRNYELRVLEGEPVLNARGTCISRGEVRNIVASKIPLRRNGEIVGLLGYFVDEGGAEANEGGVSFDGFARMAQTDALTGIPNLRGLAASAVAYEESFSVGGPDFVFLLADIRDMGGLNEVYGRSFGNRILRIVAQHLMDSYGVSSAVARVGGDKFAAIRQVEDQDDAKREAELLHEVIESVCEVDGIPVRLECKVGWALYSERGDISDVLALADERLRHARR